MPWTRDEIDDQMLDDGCPYCGGEGVRLGECTCMDDVCCCLEMIPPVCEHCGGNG